eukprot:gene25536-30832_t
MKRCPLQIETTGLEKLEELEDLEVLFLTFKEIANLQYCPNLRRLSLIDNGIERISNLQPVSHSLRILCLCDQNITVVEDLELPHLRELYLHRNRITTIQSLSKCPRIKKLWLFQNHLQQIDFVCNLVELEEIWLQCNDINTLQPFNHCVNMKSLHMSANPIKSLVEVKHLLSLGRLTHLSFSDIHFGKCNIVDEDGYKNYLILLLKQVQVLDGVVINREHVQTAEEEYYNQVRGYNDALREIEDSYQKSLRAIDIQHQTRESYSQVLEKEMNAALKELQVLVHEGRSAIQKDLTHTTKLLDTNYASFLDHLDVLTHSTLSNMQAYLQIFHAQYTESLFMVSLLLHIHSYHNHIIQKLVAMKKQKNSSGMAFSTVQNSSADFLFVVSMLNPALLPASSPTMPSLDTSSSIYTLELAKLYKIILPSKARNSNNNKFVSDSSSSSEYRCIYTYMSLEDWESFVVQHGGNWQSFKQSQGNSVQIFSDDPALLATLYSPYIPTPSEFATASSAAATKLSEGKVSSPSKKGNSKGGGGVGMKDTVVPRPVIMLGFQVDALLIPAADPSTSFKMLPFPPSDAAKQQLLEHLLSSSPSTPIIHKVANLPHAHLFSVPPSHCDHHTQLEYICLCVQVVPLHSGVNANDLVLRGLEAKLELLLMPTHHVQATSQLLTKFEQESSSLVQHYMVKMLEEVDETQAQSYISTERDVQHREVSMRNVREDIEGERRKQEMQLRELRNMSANSAANPGNSAGKGSGRRV